MPNFKEVPYWKARQFEEVGKKDGLMFKENTNYWGLYINRKLVGIVGYDLLKNGSAVLRSDYVVPEYRGRGIYRMLHEHRMQILMDKGIKHMVITCTENSYPMHKKLGAIPIKEYKRFIKMEYRL